MALALARPCALSLVVEARHAVAVDEDAALGAEAELGALQEAKETVSTSARHERKEAMQKATAS